MGSRVMAPYCLPHQPVWQPADWRVNLYPDACLVCWVNDWVRDQKAKRARGEE